uniref:TF-B3 domain-containing protein n=1 Tax=Oryza punctata TaxID=4537 RepID=A0A0E0L6X1_ORYPU
MQQPDTDPTKLKAKAIIKPKVEPCHDDDELPAPPPPVSGSDEDWEATTPLTAGNPFFTAVIAKSHLHPKFQMWIPPRFLHWLPEPEARTAAVLHSGGKSWPTSYCGDLKMKKLDSGWSEFAVDNRLRVGDACVFELIAIGVAGGLEFQVQILRGGLPAEVVTSKGVTSDEPIVIVD